MEEGYGNGSGYVPACRYAEWLRRQQQADTEGV